MIDRQQLRLQIRQRRQALSSEHQQQASNQLLQQLINHPKVQAAGKIALYLANDGELDPMLIIKALWQLDKEVYLPVIHPFHSGQMMFIRYQAHTKMIPNTFGIPEPELDVTKVCPVDQLDIVFTPLVAFDAEGNRMGMGGGYYDRTLQHWQENQRPYPIGLAHECQQVEHLEQQHWDVPLAEIITPSRMIKGV